MKLNIPYYPQKDNYTCGPAALQMVISFLGEYHSQKQLIKFSGLTKKRLKKIGTSNEKMIETALNTGLCCYVNNDSTIEEIKYFIRLGFPVIVNYIEPTYEMGHFAVITGYSKFTKKLIMNDPWNGKNFKISETPFLRRWKSEYNHHKRWILVLSKKPFALGKQYLPKKNSRKPQSPAPVPLLPSTEIYPRINLSL